MIEGPVDLNHALGQEMKYAVLPESTTTKKAKMMHNDKENFFLEPNHSHFLLVDNGTINQNNTEINLRILLEDKLDTMWESCASMKVNNSI